MKIKIMLMIGLLALVPFIAEAKQEKKMNVELVTNLGTIKLELYPEEAPKSVANFVEYAKEGHYVDTVFHRVIDGFMIQGGGFTVDLDQKPCKKPIENEATNGLKNARGTIAMARTMDVDSATAQFFINVAENEFLNHRNTTVSGYGYCVFGAVVEGMEIVDKIAKTKTGTRGHYQDVPKDDIVIKEVRVETPAG